MARRTGDDITDTETRRVAGQTYVLPANYAREFDTAFGDDDEEAKEFADFFDEMVEANDYAKVTVYRVPVNEKGTLTSRKLSYLFDFSLGEMSYSQMSAKIRDDYGTGVYRVQMRDAKGQMLKQRTVSVEAPKNADPKPAAENNLVSSIAYAMERQNEQMQRMFESFGNQRPSFDFKEVIGYVVPIATALGALGISFKSKPEKSLTETLAEIAAIKELFSNNDEGGESNFFSMMETTLKSFGPAFAQAIAMGQNSAAKPGAPAALPNPNRPDPMQEKIKEMKPQLDFVLMQVKTGATASTVADFFVDNLLANEAVSDAEIDAIEQFLELPDCFRRCVAVVPEWANYAQWFEAWRVAMLKGLQETEADDAGENPDLTKSGESLDTLPDATSDLNANSERASGDARDAAHHASASAPMETQSGVTDADP